MKKTKLNRRHFIQQSLMLSSSLAVGSLSPIRVLADVGTPSDPHYMVLLRASGGAHAPLGLDPLIPSELENRSIDPVEIDTGDASHLRGFYAAYRDSDLLGSRDLLLGVAAQPLLQHVQDIAIVNGVMLLPQSPFHEVCRKYSSTGNNNEDSPLFPFQLHMDLRRESALGVAYNGFQDQDLKQKYFGTPINDIRNQSGSSYARHLDLLGLRETNSGESSNALSDGINSIMQTRDKGEVFNTLLSEYRDLQTGNPNQDVQTMAAGLNSGFFDMATLDLNVTGSLDTHSNHGTGHAQSLENVFQQISDIFTLFKNAPCLKTNKGLSLFDQTTFVFTSDFCRSSWKQGDDGTDHNPLNNSFLLAGKKIKGGQKIGASTVITPSLFPSDPRSRLQALPFHFTEGRALTFEEMVDTRSHLVFDTKNGSLILGEKCSRGATPGPDCVDFLTPGSIYKTLGKAFGIPHGTSYTSMEKTIPGLIREDS